MKPKWALAMLFLADGMGFGTWAAHVAVFKSRLSLSNAHLTLVLLSLIGGAIITMPVVGQLIHRYGSRSVVRIVSLSYFVILAALGQAVGLHSLIPLAFLFGMAKGAFDVSVNSQVFAVEAHYGRSYQGLFQGSWSVGGLLGASLSSLLLSQGGSAREDLGGIALLLGLCTLIALPLLVSEPPSSEHTERLTWPDASLLRVATIAFFGLMTEGAIADWASVYLHSHVHVSLSQAAIGYAAFSVTMAASRFLSDWMVQHFSAEQILKASGLCIALGMGVALAVPFWWPTLLGFVIMGLGTATIVPVTFSIAGSNTRMGAGPAISAISTIGYFGFLAGPPLIGSIAIFAGLRLALVLVVAAGAIIAVLPLLVKLQDEPATTTDGKASHPHLSA